jgi:hypothetical protein
MGEFSAATIVSSTVTPAAEAAAKLRDFMDSTGTILPPTARLADASGALTALVNELESEGGQPTTPGNWRSKRCSVLPTNPLDLQT